MFMSEQDYLDDLADREPVSLWELNHERYAAELRSLNVPEYEEWVYDQAVARLTDDLNDLAAYADLVAITSEA